MSIKLNQSLTPTFTRNTAAIKRDYSSVAVDELRYEKMSDPIVVDTARALSLGVYSVTASGAPMTIAETFGRNSVAYERNADSVNSVTSGVIRYENVGSATGIMVEMGTTNKAGGGDNLRDTWWWTGTTNVITTGAITSPDGTMTGNKFFIASPGSAHFFHNNNAFLSAVGGPGSWSCYAKKGEYNYIGLEFASNGTPDPYICIFNLDTGVIEWTGSDIARSGIEAVGDGWYRCWVSKTIGAGDANPRIHLYSTFTPPSTVGTAGSTIGYGVYVWGVQAEHTSYPTSYHATNNNTDAAIARTTRLDESLTFANPLPNVASGCVVVRAYAERETAATTAVTNRTLVYHKSTSTNDQISLFKNTSASGLIFRLTNSSGTASDLTVSKVLSEGYHSFGLVWSATEQSLWVDGVQVGTQVPTQTPSVSGSWFTGCNPNAATECWNSPIDELAVLEQVPTNGNMAIYTAASGYSIPTGTVSLVYQRKYDNNSDYFGWNYRASYWNSGWTSPWYTSYVSGGIWDTFVPTETLPSTGTTITYQFRTTNNDDYSSPGSYNPAVTGVVGKYIQVDAAMSQDASGQIAVLDGFTLTPQNLGKCVRFESNATNAVYSSWNAPASGDYAVTADASYYFQLLGNSSSTGSVDVTHKQFLDVDADWNTGTRRHCSGTGDELVINNPVVTFTRTVTGNYYDLTQTPAAVDGTRYAVVDGVTGIIIEEATAIANLWSEELDNAYWTKTNSSVTGNVITAPDGTMTGDKLTDNTTNSTHTITRNSLIGDGAISVSVYAKKDTLDRFYIDWNNSANNRVLFDLTNGVILSMGSSAMGTIKSVGDGWYRCAMFWNDTNDTTTQVNIGCVQNGGTTVSYAGTGDSLYLWGINAAARFMPTTYIKTEGTTVTRTEDVCNVSATGMIASNGSEGAVIVRAYVSEEHAVTGNVNSRMLFSMQSGSTSNHQVAIIKNTTGGWTFVLRNSSGSATNIAVAKTLSVGWHTFGCLWNQTGGPQELWIDGVQEVSGVVANRPSTSSLTLNIGKTAASSNQHWNGLIGQIDVFRVVPSFDEMTSYTDPTGGIQNLALTTAHSFRMKFDGTLNGGVPYNGVVGDRQDGPYSLANLQGVSGNIVSWNETPGSGSVVVSSSLDSLVWSPVSNGGSVSGLVDNSQTVYLRQTLLAENANNTLPTMQDFTFLVGENYNPPSYMNNNTNNAYTASDGTFSSVALKPLFSTLTLVPNNLSKWQLHNSTTRPSFWSESGTMGVEKLDVPVTGNVLDLNQGTIIIKVKFEPHHIIAVTRTLFYHFAGSSVRNVIKLIRHSSNTFQFFIRDDNATGGGLASFTTSGMVLGWNTFGCTWSSGAMYLWLNGERVGEDTTVGTLPTILGTMTIGRIDPSSELFHGDISQFDIYRSVLSDADMTAKTLPNIAGDFVGDETSYQLKFNDNLKYGLTGYYTTKFMDAGENAANTPWIETIKTDSTPVGTSLSYRFRTSALGSSADAVAWNSNITALTGRYMQVEVKMKSDDVALLTPTVDDIEVVAKYS